MPVVSQRIGEQFGVGRHGGLIEAPFEAGAAVALDLGLDHSDGVQAREALAREALVWEAGFVGKLPVRGEPVVVSANLVAAERDAPVVSVSLLAGDRSNGKGLPPPPLHSPSFHRPSFHQGARRALPSCPSAPHLGSDRIR